MDALFARYARPYELLDTVIRSRRLAGFIATFWERQNDDELFQMWLHKCWSSEGFEQFKRRVSQRVAPQRPTRRQVEATVRDSLSILDSFDPEGVSR